VFVFGAWEVLAAPIGKVREHILVLLLLVNLVQTVKHFPNKLLFPRVHHPTFLSPSASLVRIVVFILNDDGSIVEVRVLSVGTVFIPLDLVDVEVLVRTLKSDRPLLQLKHGVVDSAPQFPILWMVHSTKRKHWHRVSLR